MADTLYNFTSQSGVRRDGTELDSPYCSDGVWVRWNRGRPRKINGYRAMSTQASGPVRSVFVDSRGGVSSAHLFSQWGIQRVQFAQDGAAMNISDRTPSGFTVNADYNWSHGAMYSSVGGTYSALIAACSPDVSDIASDTGGAIYAGDISTNDPLTQISDGSGPILVSGGICVLQPFLFAYGSNGLIRNSNTNDYSTASGWTTGGANMASSNNVAGTKVVHGAPLRGGSQSPAGLFWALDSLIRVSFVGGTALWNYDTLASPTTVLSKKAIVEVDGKFFWPGMDRFMFYNGVVQELPNAMNLNYFFDNLNYTYANKVWGTRIARFGEIWWFYPRGTDTECGNAVIFNYKENTWYDAVKVRSAGAPTGVFKSPVWAGGEDSVSTQLLTTGLKLTTSAATLAGSAVLTFASTTGIVDGMVASGVDGIPFGSTVFSHTGTQITLNNVTTGAGVPSGSVLSFTSMTTAFAEGVTVTGGTSGATGTAERVFTTNLNVSSVTGTFVSGETITGSGGATAKIQSAPVSQDLHSVYQHEIGFDKVVGQNITAIPSSFTSRNFGFAIGGPLEDAPKSLDMLTRVQRYEPDFNQVGPLDVTVQARDFAQGERVDLTTYALEQGALMQDMVDQGRIMTIKVESNVVGGFYEQGQVMLKMEPGDERSAI